MEAPCNRCYRRSTHMASDPATIFAQTPCVLSLPTDSPCGPLCEMLKPTCPRAGKSRSAWEFTSQWEGWGCINTPTPLPLMGTTLWCNLCTPAVELKQIYPPWDSACGTPFSDSFSYWFSFPNTLPDFPGNTSPKNHIHMNPFLRICHQRTQTKKHLRVKSGSKFPKRQSLTRNTCYMYRTLVSTSLCGSF